MLKPFLPTLFAAAALAAAAPAAGPPPVVGDAPSHRENVAFEQRLGEPVPLDVPFRDENEQPITLRQAVGGKPTVLVLAYYRCPMLCTQVLNGLTDALREMPADYTAGGKFNVVTVSFDPKEHGNLASEKKKAYLQSYGREGAEWRFLTGPQDSIVALTKAVGFKYEYDKFFKDYNHASGLIVLTPEGKTARYFLGLGYNEEYKVPGGTTTLRLSLVEASKGTIGSVVDRITLFCAPFDHTQNRYSLRIFRVVQAAGVVTVFAIAVGTAFLFRSDRRKRFAATTPATTTATLAHDGPPSGGTA